MSMENFEQQNAFNEKMFEVLENHFSYEEESRKMITELSANVAESAKTIAALATKLNARQTRFTIAAAVMVAFGIKKYKDLEKRIEKLEISKAKE